MKVFGCGFEVSTDLDLFWASLRNPEPEKYWIEGSILVMCGQFMGPQRVSTMYSSLYSMYRSPSAKYSCPGNYPERPWTAHGF